MKSAAPSAVCKMNPDGTQDVNLRAWVGPKDCGARIDERGTTCGQGGIDTSPLKFTTQLKDFEVQFGTVYAGSENAADVNDRSDVKLSAEKWILAGSKYGFTVKGASRAELTGLVEGSGKECDCDFGNYSDQWPRGKASGKLNLWRADRTTPVRVRCIQADSPELIPGSGPYVFVAPNPAAWWHGLFIEFFLFMRRNRLAFT